MKIGSIVIHCYEFDKMLEFWQQALRYVPREPATGDWVVLREVDRLIKIGATRYPWRYRPGSDFVVLEDPDGNLFCVVQKNF